MLFCCYILWTKSNTRLCDETSAATVIGKLRNANAIIEFSMDGWNGTMVMICVVECDK